MVLPMPEPTQPPLPLGQYKVLSFDIYGSLIEYKAQILSSFAPILSRLPPSSPYLDATLLSTPVPNSATTGSIEFLKLFQRQEDIIKLERPPRRFDEILREIWTRIAAELNVETTSDETTAFGSEANIASWPTFEGTTDALILLSKHYKLVALSNIDRYAWLITAKSPASQLGEVDWWKVFTAEDFEGNPSEADDTKLKALMAYAASEGIRQEEILHVAQSLGHDQAPAKRLGLSSVWLVGDGPRWGKESESRTALEKKLVGYGWRFADLREFAREVERVCGQEG